MFDIFWILKNPKAYIVSLLGGGLMMLGVFYTMFAYQAEGDYTFTAFAGDMAEVLDLPSIPGVYENPARAALAAEGGMADALPPGRDGWTRRAWQAEDGDKLIAASQQLAADQQWLGASAVDEFLEVARGDVPGVLETYVRGDERIVVMIRRYSTAYDWEDGLSVAERVKATDRMVTSGIAPLAVHGVELHGFMIPATGETLPFERLSGSLAGQISIEVATNTDRAALVKLLSGLDIAWLNRFADTPDPIVSAQKGVAVAPGLTAGEAAPIRLEFEVTRGASRAQAPVAGDAEGEPPVVCIRRAGKRVCD